MKRFRMTAFGCALATMIACFCVIPTQRAQADASQPAPAIVQNGFNIWATKNSASYAFDVWKKGGLLETDRKPGNQVSYFSRLDSTLGDYKSFDVVDSKRIGPNSQILYVAINFQRAAVFGRFQLYKTDKGWVVQNMDFSLKPETLMPWLAFSGDTDNTQ